MVERFSRTSKIERMHRCSYTSCELAWNSVLSYFGSTMATCRAWIPLNEDQNTLAPGKRN